MRRKKAVIGQLGVIVAAMMWGAGQASAQVAPTADYMGTTPNYANSQLPTVMNGVVTGGGIHKFVDSLPGLGAANANNLGQFIPIAQPITGVAGVPADGDYYEIGLVDYTQKLHTDLLPTQLRGYRDLSPAADGKAHYLGPVIIANRDRPVRVKFTNSLAVGAAGNLFLPVDTSLMGVGMGPLNAAGGACNPATQTCASYPQNRASLHMHGGVTPWISDGTPHQWITPAGEAPYIKGVSQNNVPDMPAPPAGSATLYYTNQQSARMMWYHDHAYGMTRLNVYAGEASGYMLTDSVEQDLINGTNLSGVNPGNAKVLPNVGGNYSLGIPLIIQDKTFVPTAAELTAEDPTWNTTLHLGGQGNLWFPHVYMPNQNPYNPDLSGANPMGRWDYGPWFWPVVTTVTHGPASITGTGTNGCALAATCPVPGTPNPSLVPEAFMDTAVVNGTPYPFLTVQQQAYRFRILNASNDRTLNLQLYYADATGKEVAMISAAPHTATSLPYPRCSALVSTNCFCNSIAVPPATPVGCFPETWPTDGRDGGVPDPAKAGPQMIQIGTEGGFLPAPVVHVNHPVGYNYNRRDIVVLNVSDKTLMLGPAERADVIVDFSTVPVGSKIILYNDSPAPVPAFDSRYDYYTGDPDQTAQGGAPTTQPGYGPNTRTMMQFVVAAATGTPTSVSLPALQAALPVAFAKSQPAPIVPESAYGQGAGNSGAYVGPGPGGTFADTYARIGDVTSMTFTPIGGGTPVTLPIRNKTIQELFELDYGRMNATLGVEVPFTNFLTQTTIPYFYVDPPTEILKGGQTQVWKITHNGVDTHSIHFHLFNVQLLNRVGWDGAIRPPEANELGWKETVRMNPLEDAIVALTPIAPAVPFVMPDSIRYLDPTSAPNSTGQFTGLDPSNNPIVVLNTINNFGHEYIWHCHLLGHEENDMMRPIVFHPNRVVSDFNGDGHSDILWRDNSTNGVSIDFMNGPSILSDNSLMAVAPEWKVTDTGDFDGDGKSDILWRNTATGQVVIWLMNGSTIAGSGSPGAVSVDWQIVGVGDFDGDGKSDILWRNTASGQVTIWLMNGSTIAGSGSLGAISADWQIVGVGDFDSDGKSDILWRNSVTGLVTTWLMNGFTIAGSGSPAAISADWQIVGVGDFSGDGKSDILWRNTASGEVYIWIMSGSMISSSGSVAVQPADWQISRVEDFNGDGKSDILWRNTVTGEVSMWLMNGLTISSKASLGTFPANLQIVP